MSFSPYVLCLVRVVAGLLFLQHGLEKLIGFAGARPEATLWGIRGVGGILETVGGPLLALGLFTRPTAFILSGEMAVAYFRSWAPRGFFPIANGGEEATLNAFIFLWLVAAGAGAFSLDAWIERRRPLGSFGQRVASWEPQARGLLRVILGFLITLHGLRKVFEVLPSVAGRRGAPPLAIDSLPPLTGYLELVAGPLLMLGVFVRQTAPIVALEALAAYLFIAQPRTLWPIRNGGIEALLYFTVFLYFAVTGAGAWSLDARRRATLHGATPMPSTRTIASSFLLVGLAAAGLAAQAPPAPAAQKPDSPAVQALVARARSAAGAMWAEEAHFFCEAPRANSPTDPPIAPSRIFDNVYAIGNTGTVAYVIRTSAGLVMIDALGANQVDSVLLPGFKALGLDPAQVKAIIIGHGHGDHFGGSAYMQETFGAKIYISAADWNLMENPPPARGGRQGGPPTPLPKHDQVIVEGQPIVVGDLSVLPVAIPGHTPGSMGFIFSVKDNGRTHTAALFGGTVLTPGIISDDGLQTYLQSVTRFKEATRKARVDVEIQNHPLMDPIQVKLDRLRARQNGQPHPFVVGEAGYQSFLDVMSICTEANIARRKQN